MLFASGELAFLTSGTAEPRDFMFCGTGYRPFGVNTRSFLTYLHLYNDSRIFTIPWGSLEHTLVLRNPLRQVPWLKHTLEWLAGLLKRNILTVKCKGLSQQAEVAQGLPVRLRPRIFLTFSTIRVVGRQPYTPAAFTPGEIPGTPFQRLSRLQGTWFSRGKRRKNPQWILTVDFINILECLGDFKEMPSVVNTPLIHQRPNRWSDFYEVQNRG